MKFALCFALLLSPPALAAGLGVELGVGVAALSGAGELALTARFPLERGRVIELKGRGYLTPRPLALPGGFNTSEFGGAAIVLRYRTAQLLPHFTLAWGGGAFFWRNCSFSDSCGGFGPIAELSPALEFDLTARVRLIVALNMSVGAVLLGNPFPWAAMSLTIGFAFDFGPVAAGTVSS